MKPFNIRFSDEKTFASLAELAKKDGRSINNYIEKVLMDHLNADTKVIPSQKQSGINVVSNVTQSPALANFKIKAVAGEVPDILIKQLSPQEWTAAKKAIEQWDEGAIAKWRADLSEATYLSQKQKDLILKS